MGDQNNATQFPKMRSNDLKHPRRTIFFKYVWDPIKMWYSKNKEGFHLYVWIMYFERVSNDELSVKF